MLPTLHKFAIRSQQLPGYFSLHEVWLACPASLCHTVSLFGPHIVESSYFLMITTSLDAMPGEGAQNQRENPNLSDLLHCLGWTLREGRLRNVLELKLIGNCLQVCRHAVVWGKCCSLHWFQEFYWETAIFCGLVISATYCTAQHSTMYHIL